MECKFSAKVSFVCLLIENFYTLTVYLDNLHRLPSQMNTYSKWHTASPPIGLHRFALQLLEARLHDSNEQQCRNGVSLFHTAGDAKGSRSCASLS